MILREAFFGVRRFDELQNRLSIAPKILSDRLVRLVRDGLFIRSRYQTSPERFEYRLTEQGKALFGAFAAMLTWGDRWLAAGNPPLILTHHPCGRDFKPTVSCGYCKEPLAARDMSYRLHYDDPAPDSRQPGNSDQQRRLVRQKRAAAR
jgi:DNA-binding HxlR family transcriptional regulator